VMPVIKVFFFILTFSIGVKAIGKKTRNRAENKIQFGLYIAPPLRLHPVSFNNKLIYLRFFNFFEL